MRLMNIYRGIYIASLLLAPRLRDHRWHCYVTAFVWMNIYIYIYISRSDLAFNLCRFSPFPSLARVPFPRNRTTIVQTSLFVRARPFSLEQIFPTAPPSRSHESRPSASVRSSSKGPNDDCRALRGGAYTLLTIDYFPTILHALSPPLLALHTGWIISHALRWT